MVCTNYIFKSKRVNDLGLYGLLRGMPRIDFNWFNLGPVVIRDLNGILENQKNKQRVSFSFESSAPSFKFLHSPGADRGGGILTE